MASMKDTKDWLIAILLSVIFGLIAFSVNREMSRLDRSIMVLHQRVNDTLKTKADKEDLGRLWGQVNRACKQGGK